MGRRHVFGRFSGSASRISELETSLAAATETTNTLQSQLRDAEASASVYQQKLESYGFAMPLPIALGALIVALVIGFVAGFWWIDSRSRKRHGGFRIY